MDRAVLQTLHSSAGPIPKHEGIRIHQKQLYIQFYTIHDFIAKKNRFLIPRNWNDPVLPHKAEMELDGIREYGSLDNKVALIPSPFWVLDWGTAALRVHRIEMLRC